MWALDKICGVEPHRHVLQDVGLELFFEDQSILLAFSSPTDCILAQKALESSSASSNLVGGASLEVWY